MIHNMFNKDLLTYCKEPQFQGQHCYGLKLKELSNRTTLVLSNTRELDRDPFTK